jgi:hypothetical protein
MYIDEDIMNRVFYDNFLSIVTGQISHKCGKLSPFHEPVDASLFHYTKIFIMIVSAMSLSLKIKYPILKVFIFLLICMNFWCTS